MKMAKASKADMDMALRLCSAMSNLERGYMPSIDDVSDTELFDEYDDEQCAATLRILLNIAQDGSLMRVIWGMHVLLDPANKIIDPDADTLEVHPEIVAMKTQRDELLEALYYAIKQVPPLGTVPGIADAIAKSESKS